MDNRINFDSDVNINLQQFEWIVKSHTAILGYYGPFKNPEEAYKSCIMLQKDPDTTLIRVRKSDY